MRTKQSNIVVDRDNASELQNNPKDNEQRLTVMEAAAYLRVSKSYLDKLRLKGGGPVFHKPGSRVFYLSSDLDAWFKGYRFTSTSEYDQGE